MKVFEAIIVPLLGILWLIFAMFLINGCTLSEEQRSFSPGPGSLEGNKLNAYELAVAAFELTVLPYALQNCQTCHGHSQVPLFARNLPKKDHEVSRRYVSFSRVQRSRLVARAKDGHCGNLCLSDGTELEEAITLWWNTGEAAYAQNQPIQLQELLVSPAAFQTLTWDLGDLQESLEGVLVQLDLIEKFGGYEASNLRITTLQDPLSVSAPSLLLNGEAIDNGIYETVNVVLPPSSTTPLSPQAVSFAMPNPIEGISLQFEQID